MVSRFHLVAVFAVGLAGLVLALLQFQAPDRLASARPLTAGEVYVVNSTADVLDANQGEGICATASGVCTLRAAIMQANFASGAQTITSPAGTFTLTLIGNDDGGIVGDLGVTGETTILGAGADVTIVDGNGDVTGDRVFQVIGGPVRFSGLTIRNGKSPALSSRGGGIYCRNAISGVALDGVIVELNRALNGGGISVEDCPLAIDSSTIRLNQATYDTNIGSGGGIFIREPSFGHIVVTVRDSQILSNTGQTGGGIFLDDGRGARIERTTIGGNQANSGGGIAHWNPAAVGPGVLTVVDSLVRDNQSLGSGGAIETRDSLILMRTQVTSNTAVSLGGALYVNKLKPTSQLSLVDSTFTANRSESGGAFAFYLAGIATSEFIVRNSTFNQNVATRDGGAIYAFDTVRLALINSTIDGNLAGRDGGGIAASTGANLGSTVSHSPTIR